MTIAGSGEIHGWRAHLAPPETHPAGTELLSQGRMPERVQLLSDGIVKLERRAPDRAPVTIGLRFPGWLLGAESVIAEQETPVSVVAVTDCALRGLARERFLGFVRVDPDLSWRVAQMYSRELVDRLERAGDREYASPETRLRHLLRRLLDANDTGPPTEGSAHAPAVHAARAGETALGLGRPVDRAPHRVAAGRRDPIAARSPDHPGRARTARGRPRPP